MMGTGIMSGENRTVEAAKAAISSPLLEGASVQGARGVIITSRADRTSRWRK